MSKRLGEAMLSHGSSNDKVGHWCSEQKILHNCPEWDIPSATPTLCSSLSLFLIFHCRTRSNWNSGFMQGQAGLLSNRSTSSIHCLKKRSSKFQIRPCLIYFSNYFTTLGCFFFYFSKVYRPPCPFNCSQWMPKCTSSHHWKITAICMWLFLLIFLWFCWNFVFHYALLLCRGHSCKKKKKKEFALPYLWHQTI